MALNTPEMVITNLEVRQSTLLDWIRDIQVTSNVEQKRAEDMLIDAKAAVKEAEEKRKELTRPLDESKARIMTLFKPCIDMLQQGISSLNTALFRYHDEKRIEAEATRLAALAEQAARIAAAGEGEIIEPLARPTEPAVAKTSYAHLGSVTYREDYDIEIVSPRDVPRDLCEPSMAKIRARVKSGVLNIPGVLVSKKYISVARTDASNRSQQEAEDEDE